MQSIHISFSSETVTLAGSLAAVRSDEPPAPVVLLLSGSAPIDRNSNMKKLAIGVMEQVAEHLASAGLASFRFDKRGVGASGELAAADPTLAGIVLLAGTASTGEHVLRWRPSR